MRGSKERPCMQFSHSLFDPNYVNSIFLEVFGKSLNNIARRQETKQEGNRIYRPIRSTVAIHS